MPQFDPTFFAPQLFWLLVMFVVLYVSMSVLAMPKIGAVLEERQRKIDDNLDKAAQLKAEADIAIAAYEKALAKQSEAKQKELGEKLAAQIKAGEARINAAKDQALAHVREVAVDVAKTATQKLTGLTVEDDQVTKAVTAVMQESR